ncbi:FGR27 Filamentous growth regulator 27 [Candida maltosa Xu316]
MSTDTSDSRKIPRKRIRRIPDDQRQKVSSACDTCKKRKFKCSGENPCSHCRKKGLDCSYTIIDKRSLRGERMAKIKLEREKEDSNPQQNQNQQQYVPTERRSSFLPPPQVSNSPYQNGLNPMYAPTLPPPGNHTQMSPRLPPATQQPNGPNFSGSFQLPPPPPPPLHHQHSFHGPDFIQSHLQQQQQQQQQPLPPILSPSESGSSSKGTTGMPTPGTTPNSSETAATSSACIPKSLQPLLSFPLDRNDDNVSLKSDQPPVEDTSTSIAKESDGPSNQHGKSAILLVDKSGTFRYMGETSPLSVLYETRNIFYEYVGSTKLTEDLRGCPVTDKPLKLTLTQVVPLPAEDERDEYIQSFKRNINDTCFMFEMDRFYGEYVNPVYSNPNNDSIQEKRVLLYLVLAIGSTYNDFSNKIPQADKGVGYFDSARFLLRDLVQDSVMWCVLCHLLKFHYYQSILKKSTALIHLNQAISFAQSLGLHRNFVNEEFSALTAECEYRKRIFRTLYICDRISPVFIGRPLMINDYDWDDPTRFKSSKYLASTVGFNARCQIELTKVCSLIGRIVANFYQDRVIDMDRTKSLALQLKLWSKNLDPSLSFDKVLNPTEIADNEDHGNTCILLVTHLLHLWAVMLLSRPFFMFEAVSNINPEMKKSYENEELSKQFCQAATKSSILAIKLMNHYINTAFKEYRRMECYVIITCCFYSSIILGITILNQSYDPEEYTETDLLNYLKNAEYILLHFSVCNEGAKRYAEISADLISALIQRHESLSTRTELGMNDYAYRILNNFNFIDDPNHTDVQNLMDFQQYFVSSDLLPIEDTANTSTSALPFDYNNYSLFFGAKY